MIDVTEVSRAQQVREQFQKATAEHDLQVFRDSGVDRHLRFSRGEDSAYRFELLTWPRHLCFTGDMGTYVFCRTYDMFEFFLPEAASTLASNPDYWAEKLLASDSQRGHREWDGEGFWQTILGRFRDWQEQEGCDEATEQAILKDLEEKIHCHVDTDPQWAEGSALEAAYHFHSHGFDLDELPTSYQFTRGFLWCCHALPWAISRYRGKDLTQPIGESL